MANEKDWLVQRDLNKIEIDHNILNLKNDELTIEVLKDNNFTDDEILLITNKINDDYKKQFGTMVCELDKTFLLSIKHLLIDVFQKLKINTIA